METPIHTLDMKPKVTPKDFFLWFGAMLALYASTVSFLVLMFEYIDRIFPDPALMSYVDPYAGNVRTAMATLIVLAPVAVILLRLIRKDIARVAEKAHLWVRRFALVGTLFVAGATLAVDLIFLINTFLGGELSERFALKVLVVFLVAALVFMHFLADIKGYWIQYPKRVRSVGIAVGVMAILTVVAGFFIIGSPTSVRMMRLDDERVSDLQTIQWQMVNYWQQKTALPATLTELADPLSGNVIPVDPETGAAYEYTKTADKAFSLCAVFGRENSATTNYQTKPMGMDTDSWSHDAGRTCFARTIDPERYPPYPKAVPAY